MILIRYPMRRVGSLGMLAALLASCGGDSSEEPGREVQGTTAATGEAGSGAADLAPTPAYLEGEWCFHRERGGGESGIVVFEADGRNRTGLVWIEGEYRLEEPQDLAAFQRSYPTIVEVEPDRFVGLLSGSHRVVFERAPCP